MSSERRYALLKHIHSDLSAQGLGIAKYRSTDSATRTGAPDNPSADTELIDFVLEANTLYEIRGYLTVLPGGGTAALEMHFDSTETLGDSGWTFTRTSTGAASTSDFQENILTPWATGGPATVASFAITGYVVTGANAPTLDFWWAGDNGIGANTVLLQKGSYITFRKLGSI